MNNRYVFYELCYFSHGKTFAFFFGGGGGGTRENHIL